MPGEDDAKDSVSEPVAIDVPAGTPGAFDGGSIDATNQGSFLLGLLSGFVGGGLVLVLVYGRCKPSTRAGMRWGFGLQLLVLALSFRSLARFVPQH